MRRAVFALLLLSLGACAEVTTYRRPDGSVYHHVNCGDTLKLESCRHAAERTCPSGFTRAPIAVRSENTPAQQCARANEDRRLNGEPETACPQEKQTDSFFVCK
ncbi:hypothetical protein CCC_02428 [Paramagnetospirillum magnetotacticum MS-1]|uniref:Lipoprotein n=1 Tax=Paramagnetospirillum magnetotacticum MS-1 TaxID=272627 RepID=A0A0C2YV22_PARME|nr:hypothetical protein [Paramagnetospirillum magnetotacticum]KIL98978.1 hypothetical protein CCC_02428 [Paramagnetospirillum magnetotacticum MS-1]